MVAITSYSRSKDGDAGMACSLSLVRSWLSHSQTSPVLIVRAYQQEGAARCCDTILGCLPLLDAINEPARAFLRTKLVPERLHSELSAMDTYVAVKDGDVVGLVALDGQYARRLYVHPSAQRQGVGRVLFDHVEQLARLRGVDCLLGEASLPSGHDQLRIAVASTVLRGNNSYVFPDVRLLAQPAAYPNVR